MTRLFSEHGIEFSKQFVESVGAARWPSTSLGCPEPGVFYDLADAPYTGFIYVLSDGTNSWEYHTNEDDSMIVRCSEIEPATRSTVNVGKEAGLDRSTGVSLMRRDFDTDQFNEVKPMTAGDHDRLVAIFDLDTQLSDPNGCVTVFRLDFSTPSGVQEIEFMCADDKNGFHVFWQEMQGTAPVIGRIIGPYLTGGPIPTLPEQ
jgi:hypothetical protein